MKLIIILSVVALSSCAKLDRTYLPPNARSSGGSGSFLQTPNSGSFQSGNSQDGFGNGGNDSGNDFNNGNGFNNGNDFVNNNDFGNARPERPQAAFERNAAILRQDSQNDGETYSYAYETENGIYAEENGVATNGVEAQGGYSYTGDDGQVYSIRYTADQNGFVPQGDHLPTPPPIPEEILKALEQNARDEAQGIFDDGSYNEAKYSDDQYNGNSNFGNGNNGNTYNNGNGFANNGNGFANNNDEAVNDEDTVVTDSATFRSGPGAQGQDSRSQSRGFAGATRAYLPPVESQRANARSGFGSRSRQPTFNARDGYNY